MRTLLSWVLPDLVLDHQSAFWRLCQAQAAGRHRRQCVYLIAGVRVKAWAAHPDDIEQERRRGGCYERRDGCCHWMRKYA